MAEGLEALPAMKKPAGVSLMFDKNCSTSSSMKRAARAVSGNMKLLKDAALMSMVA